MIGDVADHDVIVVDDEIDTAGSASQAVNLAKASGARNIYLISVHPVLSGDAVQRLAALPVKEIITTNTIPILPEKCSLLKGKLTVLSIAPLLAEVIIRAHEGRSVGEMFDE
jgi:ribose-phosphate pyrophosphokinase